GLALVLALWGAIRIRGAMRDAAAAPADEAMMMDDVSGFVGKVTLTDLAILSFVASLAFMALEMTAGRMVQRHLGSSVYGWTSVIGVLLGGLSIGNWIGGKIADKVREEKQASWLFLVASMFVLSIL